MCVLGAQALSVPDAHDHLETRSPVPRVSPIPLALRVLCTPDLGTDLVHEYTRTLHSGRYLLPYGACFVIATALAVEWSTDSTSATSTSLPSWAMRSLSLSRSLDRRTPPARSHYGYRTSMTMHDHDVACSFSFRPGPLRRPSAFSRSPIQWTLHTGRWATRRLLSGAAMIYRGGPWLLSF